MFWGREENLILLFVVLEIRLFGLHSELKNVRVGYLLGFVWDPILRSPLHSKLRMAGHPFENLGDP